MELYYKDLISEENSLEKLVDDLMLLVQGANEFAEAAGANLSHLPNEELKTRLERLKEGCRRVKEQARKSALATERVVKDYPYTSMGFAFAIGMVAGVMLRRR
jgi:ElaB/YqjD/DUF883 family membrane-anchored ribosome-binding protein